MKLLTSVGLLFIAALALADQPSTDKLLKDASATAMKSKKNVLVIFHASWCGWCKRFDKFLDTTEEGKMVRSGLEVVHVTVMESGKMKENENPGGMELITKLGGDKAGLPFMAILDAKTGKMLVNSLQKEGVQATNTGYPAAPEEVAHFIKMLSVGAPAIKADTRMKIQTWLTANAPK